MYKDINMKYAQYLLTLEELEKHINELNEEHKRGVYLDLADASSFNNSETAINKETKLIIVGSITPPKGENYYYTSKENNLYKFIDKYLNKDIFEKNKTNKEELIKELKAHHIGFIDVFSKVIRVKDSASDNDILLGTLDYSSFKERLELPSDVLIVPNTKLAADLLNIIINKEDIKINGEIKYQSLFKRIKEENLYNEWRDNVFNGRIIK